METAMYSMIVVLFILGWGGDAMIGVLKNRRQLSLTEYSWCINGTMKEQITPFYPLISFFVWPLGSFCSSFKCVSNSSDTETKPFECSSYEGFGSLLSLQAMRCWWPAPAEVEEDGRTSCAWPGCRGPSGVTTLFSVFQLCINARWAQVN